MIGIIDNKMGNLASVENALNYLSIPNEIFSNPLHIKKYDKIILPGVGAFGNAMKNLINSGFYDTIKEEVLVKNKPILGVCLGMQLLLSQSTEHGFHKGLNLIEGTVTHFKERFTHLPIPHMGWNDVIPQKSSLLPTESSDNCFYFVHSYYCMIADTNDIAGITDYGIDFHSMVERKHIFGCQFHPEKSQKAGMNIYQSFFKL
jgi:imidazole glycerol-phosphate synthase subunit HisH